MLSFSTKGVATAAVDSVRQATELARSRRPDLILDGELQFDAAIAPAVAAQKAPGSLLEGNANASASSLSAGNIGAKIAAHGQVQRAGADDPGPAPANARPSARL